MAISDYIARVFGKKAVWLYRITVDGVDYHMTSRALPFTSSANKPDEDHPTGQLFSVTPLIRGEITETTSENRSEMWLRFPTSLAVTQAIINYNSYADITVKVWQTYAGDPDEEYAVRFQGRVSDINADNYLTEITCETDLTKMTTSSVAEVMQLTCRHVHYVTNADGGGCGLDATGWYQAAQVDAVSGRTLDVPLAALVEDGDYLSGLVKYNDIEYNIEAHVGSLITVDQEIPGLADDVEDENIIAQVMIAEGCSLIPTRCAYFSNSLNYGGFWEMDDNPFDGSSFA